MELLSIFVALRLGVTVKSMNKVISSAIIHLKSLSDVIIKILTNFFFFARKSFLGDQLGDGLGDRIAL